MVHFICTSGPVHSGLVPLGFNIRSDGKAQSGVTVEMGRMNFIQTPDSVLFLSMQLLDEVVSLILYLLLL